MRIVNFNVSEDERIELEVIESSFPHSFESLQLSMVFQYDIPQKQALASATDIFLARRTSWFISGGYSWTLDLTKLKEAIKSCSDLEWLNGRLTVQPEYRRTKDYYRYHCSLAITLMPEDLIRELTDRKGFTSPEELLPSLSKFRKSYPNPMKNAFIIMRLSKTRAHIAILRAIKSTLSKYSLHGLRSDDKEYSDDLLTNIRTYMHGCGFGIAVFERLLEEEFNPNISLEVGYMTALGKPVLLLKDKTLRHLHTDIVGKLYRDFDPQDPKGTIPRQIESWLRDKGLIL